MDDDGRRNANDVDFETLLRAVQVQLHRRPSSWHLFQLFFFFRYIITQYLPPRCSQKKCPKVPRDRNQLTHNLLFFPPRLVWILLWWHCLLTHQKLEKKLHFFLFFFSPLLTNKFGTGCVVRYVASGEELRSPYNIHSRKLLKWNKLPFYSIFLLLLCQLTYLDGTKWLNGMWNICAWTTWTCDRFFESRNNKYRDYTNGAIGNITRRCEETHGKNRSEANGVVERRKWFAKGLSY